jgi:hypothetical protein
VFEHLDKHDPNCLFTIDSQIAQKALEKVAIENPRYD